MHLLGESISHYAILEKLGEGGMGVVYRAEDTRLRRTVALKFLKEQAFGSTEDRARFLHEAQAAAVLDHPNICTVYEVDEKDGHTFIAMAYCSGRSLKDIVRQRRLPVAEAVESPYRSPRAWKRPTARASSTGTSSARTS